MPIGDRPAHPLEKEQVQRLLAMPNPKVRTGCRDQVLYGLFYTTGIRLNEALSARMAHISFEQHSIRIMKPKNLRRGAPTREVGIPPGLWPLFEKWLEMRGGHVGYIFDTRSHKKINDRNCRRGLVLYARRAGIDRSIGPHAFRHTVAKELDEEGVSMRKIQIILGHADLSTTAKYLSHIGSKEGVEALQAREFVIHG